MEAKYTTHDMWFNLAVWRDNFKQELDKLDHVEEVPTNYFKARREFRVRQEAARVLRPIYNAFDEAANRLENDFRREAGLETGPESVAREEEYYD